MPLAPSAAEVADGIGSRYRSDSGLLWSVAWWCGVLLALLALATILSLWLPFRLGNLDWEFGTATQTASALPLLMAGLGGMLVGAMGMARPSRLLVVAGFCVALVAVLLMVGAVFGTTAVIAWQRLQGAAPELRIGVARAVARTSWFLLLSVAGCLVGVVLSLTSRKRAQSA